MPAQPHQLALVPEPFRHLVPDHGKSPWHPSVKATARVPDPAPEPTVHEGCEGVVSIAHHSQVYRGGRVYGDWPWVYRCNTCAAMVGMHPFTRIPLGTLAGEALRKVRTDCKQPFQLLWQHHKQDRTEVYSALAQHLGIHTSDCHFGMFDEHQCKAARAWAVERLRSLTQSQPAKESHP